MCLCRQIRELAESFDEKEARKLTPSLNSHLDMIRKLYAKSRTFATCLKYDVKEKHQRSTKILSLKTLDTTRQEQILRSFQGRTQEFWAQNDDATQLELGRRLLCVVLHIKHRLSNGVRVPSTISVFAPGANSTDLRYAGKRFIDIARRLGGVGSLLCLPLEIPSSTYERYVSYADDGIINHLQTIGITQKAPQFTKFVKDLLNLQLQDGLVRSSFDLSLEFEDIIPDSDQLLLLFRSLGGIDIPEFLIKSVQQIQNRWNDDGQLFELDARQAGLPSELCAILSDDKRRTEALRSLHTILVEATDSHILSWSIAAWWGPVNMLSIKTESKWIEIALKLVWFSCPPCFAGNTRWSAKHRAVVLNLLRRFMETNPVPSHLNNHVLETLLYLAEDGALDIRRSAIELAATLLHKRTPGYLRASISLFRSIVDRLDGNLTKSDLEIQRYFNAHQHGSNRRDHALSGRLHLSRVENSIQRHDYGIASVIYSWEALYPSSPLERDVTHRILLCAAKFFQSIGEFQIARDSLQECLAIDCAKNRPLIISRLADVLCELRDYESADMNLRLELNAIEDSGKRGRPWRRLQLALVEVAIGQGVLEAAEDGLSELVDNRLHPKDITDQLLHIRTLMARARIPHYRCNYEEALWRWRIALHDIRQFSSFKCGHGFTTALIYLSIAHAQVHHGDELGGRQSWQAASEILKMEPPDYWIPVVATTWLSKITNDLRYLATIRK